MCHVIFGLDTTFADEFMVDTRTVLSCDVGFRKYMRYLMTNPEAKAIFKEGRVSKIHLDNDSHDSRVLRAAWAAWKMPKKWPWMPPPAFQRRALSELRQEFGINRYLELAFFKLTRFSRKSMFRSQWKML